MSTSSSSSSVALPITFYRYRKDGSPNPDIKRAFLQSVVLRAEDAIEGRLWLEDKSEWKLVLEEPVRQALREHSFVPCIISFQLRTNGCYAVARLETLSQTETQTNTNGETL